MDFSSDDDLHICGKCKQGFSKLDEWLQHKRVRACINARSGRRPLPRCDPGNGAEAFGSIGCPKSQQQQQQQQHAGHGKPCRTVESVSEQAAGLKSCAVRGAEKGKEQEEEEQEDDGDNDEDEDLSETSSSSDDASDNGTSENHTESFSFVSNGCGRGDMQTNGNVHNSFGGDTDSPRGRREAGIEGEPAASRDNDNNASCDDGDTDADEDGDDEACSTNGDGRGQQADCADSMQGVVAAGDSGRSIITRNLFPIVRCIRKRERPGVVDAGCPSPGSVGGHSPTSGGGADQPGSVKRKRGYPQRMGSAVLDDASAASEPCGTGGTPAAVHAAAAACNGADASAAIATMLPPVHKCERCRKGFMKISHLHRHMNKKNPCKPRVETAAAYAGAVCKTVDSRVPAESSPAQQQSSLPSAPSLPPSIGAGGQQTVPSLGFATGGLVDPAVTAAASAAAQLPLSKGAFHCGICHSDCGTYDAVVSHHSSQHLLFYPGYCRFCGRYCDKKTDLLLHLSTHTAADIVGEVAAEMRRVRQTKVERHGLNALVTATIGGGGSASASAGVLGSIVSGRLPPPADQAATQSAVTVSCAVCAIVCERETDLLQHHNGCHTPVGLCATLVDLRRGRGAESSCGGAIAAHSLWKNCFICCLKFNEASEFEDHIIYHRTWVSPREQHTVGVTDSWRSTKQERPADCDGILVAKSEQRAAAGVTRAACGLLGAVAAGHPTNGCSDGTPSSDNSCSWWSTAKESRSLICWLCTKPFNQYEAWRWHLSGDHGLRPVYQCAHDACRRVFEAWHELAAHSREHAQHAFVCAVCNRHASTQSSLLAHAEAHRHLGMPWFPPPAVPSSETMPSVSAEQHQQQLLHRRNEGVGQSSNAGGQSQQFLYARYDYTSCELCDQVLSDPQQLEAHLEQCRRHIVQCVDCGQEVHRAKLVHHVTSGHQQSLPPVLPGQPLTPAAAAGAATAASSTASDGSTDTKRFSCDLCTSAFPVKERLTQHVKNVHGPRKYVCQVCGAAFKRSDKLKRHFSLHSDDRPFVCPYPSCGRGFKRADGLRAHARYHEPLSSTLPGSLSLSGPYVCTHCDAAFESPTSYALHLRLDHGADILDGISENGRC